MVHRRVRRFVRRIFRRRTSTPTQTSGPVQSFPVTQSFPGPVQSFPSGGGSTTTPRRRGGGSIQTIAPTQTLLKKTPVSTKKAKTIQRRKQEIRRSVLRVTRKVSEIVRRKKEEIKRLKKRGPQSFPRTKTQKAITNFGLKIEKKIESLRQSTLRTLSPSFRKEANKQIQESGRIEKRFDNLNKEINSFDKKFIGRQLNEKEFNQASNKSRILKNQIGDFDKLVEKTKKDQAKRLSEEQKLGPFKPFTLGVISSPFSLASSSVALLTRPGVGKEFIKGVKQIPKQFAEAPITTAGEITGQLVGTSLVFKGGSSLKRIASSKALVNSGKSFIIEKPGKIKKTPLSVTFPEEFKLRINDKNVDSFIKQQLKSRGINFNKLSKTDIKFLRGQVKAKIRNNPELFISKARRRALRNVEKTELKKVIQERLEGKFDKPIIIKGKKSIRKLTSIQKRALKRFARLEELSRIKRATTSRLRIKKEKPIRINRFERNIIINRIRARIRADPTLTLTKLQRKTLKITKTKSELERIEKSISRRLKIKKEKPIQLSKQQKGFIKSRIKSIIKSQPERFIPKSRRRALKRLQSQQEKRAIKRAIRKGPKKIKVLDLLSKSDKKFIKGQIKAQARTQPEKFIPSARRQALIQIQKPKVKTQLVKIKIEGRVTPTLKLALKRFKRLNRKEVQTNRAIKNLNKNQVQIQKIIRTTTKQIKKVKRKDRVLSKKRIQDLITGRIKLSKRDIRLLGTRQITKARIKLKQLQKQKLKPGRKLRQTEKQRFKKVQRQKFKLKQILKQKFIFGLRQKQLSKQSQSFKLKILQKLKQPSRIRELQRIKQTERIKERVPKKLKLKQVPERKKFLIARGRRKVRRQKIRATKQQSFNVFARPLKKRGQKRRPKLIKVNLRPLTKRKAKDLRNYIADQSLSRTARIKPTRGKSRQPRLRVPSGYARRTSRKFRRHKRVRGRRVALSKGKVIERRRFLLDTLGEKRGISLKRAIAKLRKQSRAKQLKSTFKRKRTLSQLQLKALAKGRAIRMKNLIRKPIKRRIAKRIITPNKRSRLLKNLKKARAVRMRNLKRR